MTADLKNFASFVTCAAFSFDIYNCCHNFVPKSWIFCHGFNPHKHKFTPDRKVTLDAIAKGLSKHDQTPILTMANSTQLAEFTVSKDRLIQALVCVSNITDKAVVRAIVYPKEVILGVAFSNMLPEGDSDHELYADYVIVEEEMLNAKFMVKSEDWPIFYISCAEQFIDAGATLPPRDNEFLKVVFYSEKETPDTLKSEVLIIGEHNSAVGSIVRHPSSREASTTLEADETKSILYG